MKIEVTCKECGARHNREIKVGDVVKPYDGSGMPNALHHLLWNGSEPCNKGRTLPLPSNEAFKPVRVLSIEGDMLAVIPLHWDNLDIRHQEMFNDKVYPALTHIWKGDYHNYKSVYDHAFWIHAPVCYIHSFGVDR